MNIGKAMIDQFGQHEQAVNSCLNEGADSILETMITKFISDVARTREAEAKALQT